MNLVDTQAGPAQQALLDIAHEHPETTLDMLSRFSLTDDHPPAIAGGTDFIGAGRHLRLPRHHEVRASNVDLKRLGAVLAVAYERGLHDFAELLLLEKLGPRTLQSLALVAEVVHGAPSRFDDPARFSFAHGGKDGHPFKVPLKTYDASLDFLRNALDRSRLADREKIDGLRRLNSFAMRVETELEPKADFAAVIAHEQAISPSLDGRSVHDDKPGRFFVGRSRQQKLF
jgi:hypothetical protein